MAKLLPRLFPGTTPAPPTKAAPTLSTILPYKFGSTITSNWCGLATSYQSWRGNNKLGYCLWIVYQARQSLHSSLVTPLPCLRQSNTRKKHLETLKLPKLSIRLYLTCFLAFFVQLVSQFLLFMNKQSYGLCHFRGKAGQTITIN